ncbi:MAG TPA: DUF4062 domain-containing protein [Thermoanaerobaculia bacterium]|nr:DUF4062 domain-containing protein [Thermoanaerobaculia bacterium]
MPTAYQSYRTFVASPSDVAAERQLAEETIANINRSFRDTLRVTIDVRKWEHVPPIATLLPAERLQDRLLQEVDQAHFFILVLYKRYGQTEPGHTLSNTEREINAILKRHEKNPRLQILAYFRELPDNPDPGEQEAEVRALRQRLQDMGLPYRQYRSPEEFRGLLTHDLYELVLKLQLSPFKHRALSAFWDFGDSGRPQVPRVGILYPPFQRQSLKEARDKDFWLRRLTAPLAFEDYKAIQKIEKHFQILGFRDYRLYPSTSTPPDLDLMNRIFLCIPRNRPALAELAKRDDLPFSFPAETSKRRPRQLLWRMSSGKTIPIISPMDRYLRQQRRKMDISGEWHGQLVRVLTKDFGVLARVRRKGYFDDQEIPLRDFFLAGLRGLGTWGGAWFIDREYKQVQKLAEAGDVVVLLETTFENGRIARVRDVSNESPEYFANELRPDVIRKRIKDFVAAG